MFWSRLLDVSVVVFRIEMVQYISIEYHIEEYNINFLLSTLLSSIYKSKQAPK